MNIANILNRPAETRAAFWGDWFRSGDIGFLDENGYLFIKRTIRMEIRAAAENTD
jgi:acyl-CoA synthetase (AMP-forming)/AMP-acid ligase II